jgi:two-component sensor histidine kinase
MIVSDLITSAARHAFGQSERNILIELSQAGSFVECRVTDNGFARANLQPGQGLKLVDALAKSLRGASQEPSGRRQSVFAKIGQEK